MADGRVAVCFGLGIMALTMAASARADEPLLPRAMPDYVGLLGSYVDPADRRDARNGYGGSFLAGFRLGDAVAAEVKLYGDGLDRENHRSRPYVIGGAFDIRATERHGFFLLAGLGAEAGSVDNAHRTSPYLEVGGGLQRHLVSALSLRVESGYRLLPLGSNGRTEGGFGGELWAGAGFVVDWRGRRQAAVSRETRAVDVVPVRCPPAPEGLQVDGDGVLVPQDSRMPRIGFATDSAVLDETAQAEIAQLATALLCGTAQQLAVQVTGHADERGGEVYNVQLSEHRAVAVREALVMAGVSSDRIAVAGQGKYEPLEKSRDADAYSVNRRIQITLYPGVPPQ